MKRIGLLLIGLTAVLSIVAQGREIAPEYGSDRTCYSADGTKIYRYYGDDYMIVRQVNRDIPDGMLTVQPYWFHLDSKYMAQHWVDNKKKFHALMEEIGLERRTIYMKIHISLKTGQYAMSEIVLRKSSVVAMADQLPLDYLFSLWDGFEVKSIIGDHEPDSDDNKYMTYQGCFW